MGEPLDLALPEAVSSVPSYRSQLTLVLPKLARAKSLSLAKSHNTSISFFKVKSSCRKYLMLTLTL